MVQFPSFWELIYSKSHETNLHSPWKNSLGPKKDNKKNIPSNYFNLVQKCTLKEEKETQPGWKSLVTRRTNQKAK